MAENKNVPRVRFSGFNDAWEECKLEELTLVLTGFPFKNEDFVDNGKYLVITNGNIQNESSTVDVSLGNRVDDLSDEIKERYYLNKNDILVTMDGTVGRTAKVVDDNMILAQRVARLVANKNTEFVYQWLNQGSFFNEMTKVSHGGTIKHISLNEISNYSATVPSNNIEQQKIGSFFKQFDNTIDLHQRKLAKLKELKQGYLQKLFPKNGSKFPQLRFAGFADAWEQRKLTEIVNRVNKSSNSDVLPKVEFEDIVSGEGRLNKDISSKLDSRKGTLFESENILYGKLRPYLKNWLFPDFEGVALGDFWVFEATDVSVPSFDYYLIQSDDYQKVANDTSGTKMPRSDWKNVSSTDFAIPSKDEQKQIGTFFKQLDNTITLHQLKIEKLNEIKKWLMQSMFV